MYWPYLRNRTNEVFAVQELAPSIAAARLVVPIFNLIAIDNVFANRAIGIAAYGQRFCLLVNLSSNALASASHALLSRLELSHPGIAMPGMEITNSTTPLEVAAFAARYVNNQCVIVHRSAPAGVNLNLLLAGLSLPAVHVYLASAFSSAAFNPVATAGNVILADGFQRQNTNGAYPSYSNFNNYCGTYAQAGYGGFGDFAAIGDYYRVGGGQASHVALHITEVNGSGVRCNHFVSNSTPTASHIHFKYDDALSQLKSYVGSASNPSFNTAGISDYFAPHTFPGLGMPKRWSLKHHIELMNRLLVQSSVVPFV